MKHTRFAWMAAGGTAAWLATSAASVWFPLTLIEQLFLMSPLMVVPLGLGIMDGAPEIGRIPSWASRGVLIAGAASLAAFGFPRGFVSGALAFGWALVTFAVGFIALRRIVQRGVGSLSHFCFISGCLYLPVAGIGLVMSRLGITALGFEEPIVLLTAVHFHNSGFAAPILVGAAAEKFQSPGSRGALRAIAAGVLATPALIAVGFVFSPALKLIATVWLALSLAGLALLTLAQLDAITPTSARMLVGVSAGSVMAGMVLSCVYAAGEFAAREWISIPTMAVTHGVLNGVGFVLCGLLGWTLASAGETKPDLTIPKNQTRKETQTCASQLLAGRDLSADIWRDGWSN